jgi:hypothetical protein
MRCRVSGRRMWESCVDTKTKFFFTFFLILDMVNLLLDDFLVDFSLVFFFIIFIVVLMLLLLLPPHSSCNFFKEWMPFVIALQFSTALDENFVCFYKFFSIRECIRWHFEIFLLEILLSSIPWGIYFSYCFPPRY